MTKEIILTNDAPQPIGPYSQAVKYGNLLFASGQIPINPKTGQIEAETIEDQTRQVMINIKAVLEKAGAGFTNVLKTTVFIKDMNDFPAMNKVYGEFFTNEPPARSTVEVARLPKDVKVEVEVIAAL